MELNRFSKEGPTTRAVLAENEKICSPQWRNPTAFGSLGFCRNCGREHSLPADAALQAALQLIAELEVKERIDLHLSEQRADPRYSTDYLFGPARGKMFGVMTAAASDGTVVRLRAFSGQYNGIWEVPGWAGPIFDLNAFHQVQDEEEKKIKALGVKIDGLATGSEQRNELLLARKQRSQNLMRNIHDLYRLRNFSGQTAGLREIFPPEMGIPTGAGDCCAPKLLQQAAEHNLVPLGIAEFYWGRENASGSRQHGRFYPSCRTKCYPLLGFMLCGLEQRT